jgi:hypothetical protein
MTLTIRNARIRVLTVVTMEATDLDKYRYRACRQTLHAAWAREWDREKKSGNNNEPTRSSWSQGDDLIQHPTIYSSSNNNNKTSCLHQTETLLPIVEIMACHHYCFDRKVQVVVVFVIVHFASGVSWLYFASTWDFSSFRIGDMPRQWILTMAIKFHSQRNCQKCV